MCSQEHKACGHAHSTHPEEELECDFGDLTLQSCCERDLEEQRKIEGYKRTLLQRDPTAVRSTIARHAVVRDEERIASAIEDEDEEEDAILGTLLQCYYCTTNCHPVTSSMSVLALQRHFVKRGWKRCMHPYLKSSIYNIVDMDLSKR